MHSCKNKTLHFVQANSARVRGQLFSATKNVRRRLVNELSNSSLKEFDSIRPSTKSHHTLPRSQLFTSQILLSMAKGARDTTQTTTKSKWTKQDAQRQSQRQAVRNIDQTWRRDWKRRRRELIDNTEKQLNSLRVQRCKTRKKMSAEQGTTPAAESKRKELREK